MSKRRLVSEAAKIQILDDCERTQRHFVCHEASEVGEDVACPVWIAKHGGQSQAYRMAGRLGIIRIIDRQSTEGETT